MGFSTCDEGYLWYGAQRVMQGEIPIRDFNSYDPGRYYWVAAVMTLLRNDGVIALRIANAIIQAVSLFLGLLLLDRDASKRSLLFLLIATVTMITWMFPWFMLFDIALSIFMIGAFSFAIERQTCTRYFFWGICVGIMAALCRQQGVCGAIGSLGVMLYFSLKRENGLWIFKGFLSWLAGAIIGYAPIFFMMAFVPGFFSAFLEDSQHSRDLFKIIYTSIPVPWPWKVPYGKISLAAEIRGVLTGFFYMAAIIFSVSSIAWVFFQRWHKRFVPSILIATAFLAFPYTLYIFIFPDVSRLGLGLFPFLIGISAILGKSAAKLRWPFLIMICCAGLVIMLPNYPGWARKQYVEVQVGGDKLCVYPESANYFTMLQRLANDYASGGRAFIALPLFPSAYSSLRRKSPLYEIYSIAPRSETFQKAEIERIKSADPGFALIWDKPFLGRENLRYSKTHPLIYRYILDHFEPLVGYSDDSAYQVYKSKRSAK